MGMLGKEEIQALLYVATNGNDAWSGKLPEPNRQRTDGPFATLVRARDAIRELKKAAGGLHQPVTIMVRGGKYYLRDKLILRAEDSGTQECPITYTAYAGEQPILSGGRRITGWKPYQGQILQAELPGARGGKWKSRQLFCNGQRMRRARWPKFDPSDPLYGGWAYAEGPAEEGSRTDLKYRPGTFRHSWAKPTELEVIYRMGVYGIQNIVPIKSIDEQNRAIALSHVGVDLNETPWYQKEVVILPDNPFYVENALEELDEPGEWCLDSEDGVLFFWPPVESIETAEVVMPALDGLITIQGGKWLTLSGFTFTETTDGDNIHHQRIEGDDVMYPQAGLRYCGDALQMSDTEHCCIERNRFYAVGGNSIYLALRNSRNVIRYNEFSQGGASAITLAGSRLRHPTFNQVCDNHIHHCGVLNAISAGIFLAVSDGNIIGHNLIEHMPDHGINLSDNPYGRNVIEYNRIRFCAELIFDTGAINSWMELGRKGDERCGHIIRFNFISDMYGCMLKNGKLAKSDGASGIYLDNYSSNCTVYGNVIARCTREGIFVHAGKNNLIENNIIVGSRCNIAFGDWVSFLDFWKPMAGFMSGNHISRNIFYQHEQGWGLFALHAWNGGVVARSDNNIFFCEQGTYTLTHLGNYDNGTTIAASALPEEQRIDTLAKWQYLGYDRNSCFEDPLFMDVAHDDFRLKPDSPALKLGFEPIDVSKIGIRGER